MRLFCSLLAIFASFAVATAATLPTQPNLDVTFAPNSRVDVPDQLGVVQTVNSYNQHLPDSRYRSADVQKKHVHALEVDLRRMPTDHPMKHFIPHNWGPNNNIKPIIHFDIEGTIFRTTQAQIAELVLAYQLAQNAMHPLELAYQAQSILVMGPKLNRAPYRHLIEVLPW